MGDEILRPPSFGRVKTLIYSLDDKSLSLVMRKAADDRRGALKIFRNYYQGKGKPCIISLYTELTSLQKSDSESVTEYMIRAQTAITALRNAAETLSDRLLVAMVLKGLPEPSKPFVIHVTQHDETILFAEFKTKLRREREPPVQATRELRGLQQRIWCASGVALRNIWPETASTNCGAVTARATYTRTGGKQHRNRDNALKVSERQMTRTWSTSSR